MARRIRAAGPLLLAALLLMMHAGTAMVPAQTPDGKVMKSGEVSLIRLSARKAGLRDFELFSRTGPSGRLIVEGFTASLGGGRISGKGHVDFANVAGPHRMRVELEGVDGTAFLHLLEVKLDGVLQARVDGGFDLSWSGTTGAQIRRTLAGSAWWKSGPGFVSDADVLKKAAQVTGIPDLRRFDVRTAGASGTFREGVLDVTQLKVEGADLEVTGTGQLNASSRDVRMTLRMRVSPEFIEKSARPEVRAVGALARGARNLAANGNRNGDRLVSLPMPLTMTGKVQDPQFHFGPFGTLDRGNAESSDRALPAKK